MSLQDRLDATSTGWRPNDQENFPGHPMSLLGHIVELDEIYTEYGAAPVIFILTDTGEWRWVVLGEVATKRILKLNPAVGDLIGVRYLGEVPSPTRVDSHGEPLLYHDWKIVLERGDGPRPVQQSLLPAQPAEPVLDASGNTF